MTLEDATWKVEIGNESKNLQRRLRFVIVILDICLILHAQHVKNTE